jgi:hypothetical protein
MPGDFAFLIRLSGHLSAETLRLALLGSFGHIDLLS